MRETLPQRRPNQTVEFDRDGLRIRMTLGFAPDGRVAEVFLNSDKLNSAIDLLLSDAAIILSIALQHGTELQALAHSVKRDGFGLALSPLGAAIDNALNPKVNS